MTGERAFVDFLRTLNGQAPGRESQVRMFDPVLLTPFFKEMAKKIIFCIWLLLILYSITLSQTPPKNIYPLISTRADVEKLMGYGVNTGANRTLYDLPDKKVRIIYYAMGCDVNQKKQLKLSKDVVLEVKVTPKTQQKTVETILNQDDFIRENLSDNHFLYFSPLRGIMVLTTWKDMLETTDEIYFLPSDSKLSDCLADSLGQDSSLAILNYTGIKETKGDKFDFPPLQVGGFLDEDSTETRTSAQKEFSEKLLKHPNSFGYIILNQKAGAPPQAVVKRRKMLIKKLERLGIRCNRLVFLNGTVGGLGGIQFFIIHRTNELAQKAEPACK